MANDLGHLGGMPATITKETRSLEEQLAACTTERARRMVRGLIKNRDAKKVEPPAGSFAATAFAMAELDDSGFDWDAWKDQEKEARYNG